MKRSIIFCIVLALLIFSWTYGPLTHQARALIVMTLRSPSDSTKVTIDAPTFEWNATPNPRETINKFHFKLATDPNFTSIVWEDTIIDGALRSMVYNGPPLTEWQAYFWTMRVKVDSLTMADTIVTYWQEEFARRFAFFFFKATLIQIYKDPNITHLPNIQTAIIWAAAGDTVWVDTGAYHENLRFYKKNLLLTSAYISDEDTATINGTIIDGSKLSRGEDNGSVVYFSPAVDSSSILMGFTIRGGTGSKVEAGTEDRFSGGGIFCDAGSSPTIMHNVITDNHVEHDGGAIFVNSAAPNILHNIIINNSAAKGSGGGIQCRFSIEVAAAPGAKQGHQGGDPEASLSTSESQSDMSQEQIENALNPRDATEVATATSLGRLAKPADEPPVPVANWWASNNGPIVRDKYLPGDTLFFSGSESYDPDSLPAPGIYRYRWQYFRHYECWKPPITSPSTVNDSIFFLAIEEGSQLGRIKVVLLVWDYDLDRSISDTLRLNIQYSPHADAGPDTGVAPGDTAWLNGTGSCDINLDDTLIYSWSQDSGATVTIGNPDSAVAFFFPEDATYLGSYVFKLKISDGMGEDSATVRITVSNPPVPVCQDDPTYGDTLVGFFIQQTVPLDACASYDPDPGDSVQRYLWLPGQRIFFDQMGDTARLPFNPSTNPALCLNSFVPQFGGLFKLYLKAQDTFGVQSQIRDSVLFSVQLPAVAMAGKDTVLRPQTRAYLKGQAKEINPDQRNSLRYLWGWVRRPSVSIELRPADTLQAVYFDAALSGIYELRLQVDDRFSVSVPDYVIVVANRLPTAVVQHVPHAFEGDTVLLDASLSYDPDSAVFQADGSLDAGGLSFAWSVRPPVPPGAEEPVIVDADQPIAKFVPYGTGLYRFQVVVNDTISVRQPPIEGINIAVLEVNVDSTYAYPIIQGNLISRNFAGSKGGGIDCNGSSPDIVNNIFYKNQSNLSGGAVSCRSFSTPQIKSNVFFGNVSKNSTGGGIADLGAQLAPAATRGFRKHLAVEYNDFWDNAGGALYEVSGNVSENIYDFPRLIDPDFGDFRFECSSPCFGAGDPLHPDIGSIIYFQPCYEIEPLGMVELALFQNPVATAVAHLVVNTDVPIKAPPVAYVKMGSNAPSAVYFTPISPKAFRGSHLFTGSGDADISVFASSLLERDTTITKSFGVQLIGADNGGTLASADRKMAVLFPQGSVKEDIYATCISVSDDSKYEFGAEPEMVPVGEAYQLGPSISFEKDLTLSFPLNDVDLKDKDRTLFAVYRYDDGNWNRLESFLDGNSVCAKAKVLGVYRLVYDPRGKHTAGIPQAFELFQNYPNPFNPKTQIKYDLPVAGHVELSVYNVLGQKVRVLVDEVQDAGHKSVIWDGRDTGGDEVASGIYFYKIKAENYQKTRKMVLIK